MDSQDTGITTDASSIMPPKGEGVLQNMASNIALIVLLAYVLLLFVLTIISSCKGKEQNQWLELTKTGFTTLGSALTLILGYYFGQKQVAEEAKRETQTTNTKLENEKAKTSLLVANMAANPTESEPEDLSKIDKSQLPKGRPRRAGDS